MKCRERLMVGLVAGLVGAAGAGVQEPDWSSMSYTLHESYQAVDADGFGTFPVAAPVKMRGILLHRPGDMLDSTPGSDPFMGGQWQLFFQAVDLEDTSVDDYTFGGTCCWMGQNIGKISGTHPQGSYTDAEWLAELDRLNQDGQTGRAFQPGDLVEIRARAPGLFYRGKTNINEQHSDVPEADFDVLLLEAGYGLPAPEVISLSAIKNGSDDFIFDPTRATGAERYQGEVIEIDDVSFVDASGWGPNADLVIQDGTGRTLPVRLGFGKGFSSYGPPMAPFDVVGIFDQEDKVPEDGWQDDYRLWLLDYDGSEFVLVRYAGADFDRDGDVDQDDGGHFEACSSGPAIEQTAPACLDADFDGDHDVDQSDFGVFQRCLSGAGTLADPGCAE